MNLIVFVSTDIQGARQMAGALEALQQQRAITMQDAAITVRKADGSNQVWQCRELVGAGRLGGLFWGTLFALIYWSRFWGLNIGSIVDDYGVDDEFIKAVSRAMSKDHSALFVLASLDATSPITSGLEAFDAQVFTHTFSLSAEKKLQAIFSPEQ